MRLKSNDGTFDGGIDTSTLEDTIDETDIFDTFERTKDNQSGIGALGSNPGIIYDIKNDKGYFRLPSVLDTSRYRFYLSSDGWLRCQTPSEGL
ncbi:MAG: hypothetical protein LBF97_05520 [Elusimicrobiota bacterium]|jgi:hypothetical protein|nr:hypothetical protein [Elusimicrobiota bacterium]